MQIHFHVLQIFYRINFQFFSSSSMSFYFDFFLFHKYHIQQIIISSELKSSSALIHVWSFLLHPFHQIHQIMKIMNFLHYLIHFCLKEEQLRKEMNLKDHEYWLNLNYLMIWWIMLYHHHYKKQQMVKNVEFIKKFKCLHFIYPFIWFILILDVKYQVI